jgi:signal transduction histidine kinase
MRHIQNILLVLCVVFSIVTAVILYFVLSGIFRPLNIISKTTKKIADGHYGERIVVKGKNDLSAMAENFNRMAEEIEKRIHMLADEAAAKQRFIDNFAHEIRTPLTSIYGNAEYMQKAVLEEGEMIEYTQSIMDKSNHIKQIANSLLQLATLRDYIPVKTKIPIQRFFDDIRNTIKKSMGDKDIQIVCKNDADAIDGQEDLLKSLFQNLCLNALTACPPKDGVICLEAKKHHDSIEMSVTDNGCGIPEESLLKVTEPFYRVDKARNRDKGGAGLGLALCKQIAEVHGAVMNIESSEGVGTKIKITFTTS